MGADAPKPTRSRAWRRIAIIFGVMLVCAILLPSLLMALAENRVNRFCQEIEIGQSIADLEKHAQEAGLEVTHRPPIPQTEGQTTPGRLTAWDGWMYARWFCDIKYEDEKVVSKEMFFLD